MPRAWCPRPEGIAKMAADKSKEHEHASPMSWPRGMRVTPIRKTWFSRLSACPRGLSLNELARHLKEPYASVAFWAKALSYPFTPLKRGRKSLIDWEKIDWSLKNCEIARQLGVSGERVRQVRLSRKLPFTSRLSTHGLKFHKFIRENRALLLEIPLRTLIAQSGAAISPATARQILKDLD